MHRNVLIGLRFPAFAVLGLLLLFLQPADAWATNSPLRIYGTPPTSVQAGQAYYFRPQAWNPGGSPLRFYIARKPAARR